MRYPQYKPGARWQVRREFSPLRDFDFVIIGPGSKPRYKLCSVRFLHPNDTDRKDFLAEYPTWHLQEHATYVGE